ncbi:hypothetical protein DPEC_G00152640 [Dallia pectoralis]|uniref:Uncharacterized protein n=1 Tax=Dallia pectoralis TaxID=75939 RepID=A0ACC2GK05_DALPE|nr:hypothetical protein DPEC_G00152640 [Dallia pectoralis]
MLSPLLILFLVEAILCTVLSEMLYKKAGGDLVFTPNMSNIAGPITGIVWKQVKDKELTNKVVDWDESLGLAVYGTFKGRATLDRVTGVLSIKDVSEKDNGEYLMEINSKIVKKYTLSVINVVPNPQITYSCNPDKTTCTLTCEGNTTDAEPVTYNWIKGEVALETSAKQLTVTKTEGSETNYKCNLTNPVSEKFSRVFEGDLFGNNPDGWWTKSRIFRLSIFVLATVLVLLVTIFHIFKTGVWFYQKESMPWEGEPEGRK